MKQEENDTDTQMPEWLNAFVDAVCGHTESFGDFRWKAYSDVDLSRPDATLIVEIRPDEDGNLTVYASTIAAMLEPDEAGPPDISMYDSNYLSISGAYRGQTLIIEFYFAPTPEEEN